MSSNLLARHFRFTLILALAGVSSGSVAQTDPDCTEPNGVFPLVAPGAHADCDEHWGVGFDEDSVTLARSNYRWESFGQSGMLSSCWNGLHTDFGIPQSWDEDPYRPQDEAPGGGAPDSANGVDCGWSAETVNLNIQSPYGFRAPIHPLAPPGIGDYLPPAPTIGAGSASLVPSGIAGESAWWNDATRQTLHQSVDLVTGLPLVRVSQLELPFDGATFRLIRTRSGHRRDQMGFGPADGDLDFDRLTASDRWWDWSGQGWMVNENPLLIVDSSVPDLVGNNPKTTWLVLDAHHSIPFQQIESNGIYAAPPRFRAKLAHNGTWSNDRFEDGSDIRGWIPGEEPTEMEIFLYDGALKYTFVIIREDIPSHVWDQTASGVGTDTAKAGSLHDRPFVNDQFEGYALFNTWSPLHTCTNPGLGLPYYGLCVQIEDQYNHKVEMNYHGVKQKSVDFFDPSTDNEFDFDTDGTACVECGQSCARKGLIQSVKLKTNDVTRWSLIYAYRGFRTSNVHAPDELLTHDGQTDSFPTEDELRFREQDLWGSYHIDRIYVYKVDALNPDPEDEIVAASTDNEHYFLSVDHDELLDLDGSSPDLDPLTELLGGGDNSTANGWTHLVQNHYVEKLEFGQRAGVWNNALKVMTAVTSRVFEDDTQSTVQSENIQRWVYQHTQDGFATPYAGPASGDSALRWDLNWLSSIYLPADVANVTTTDELGFNNVATLDNLVYMTHPDTGLSLTDEPDQLGAMTKYASYRFGNGQHSSDTWPTNTGSQDAPDQVSLVTKYLVNDKSKLMTDMRFQMVGKAALPGDDGRVHYYQINRLRVMPGFQHIQGDYYTEGREFVSEWFSVGEEMNMRSAFVHPYQWHGYAPKWDGGWPDSSTSQSPDLTAVRWITVIDEYADERDLYPSSTDLAAGYGVYTGENATKKSQMSRRIVELSPSGYLLRERKWEYSEDGVMRSGGGLGEQYIYRTIEDYFADKGNPLPDRPSQGSSGAGRSRYTDALTSIRDELLKVEYRSIGWSAGELIEFDVNHPDNTSDYASQNGYTRFTDYDVFHPEGETWATYVESVQATRLSEKAIPLISRVQPVAEGFHRGSDYTTPENGVGWVPSPNNNEHLYTSQVIRDSVVPTDVIAQVDFVSKTLAVDLLDGLPSANWQSPDLSYQVQRTIIERDDSLDDEGNEVPEEEQPVTSRMIVGIPRQMFPGSSWYYPVEREFYDEEGNPTWACTGQLMDPSDPNQASRTDPDPYESLTFTYYQRDDEGRSLNTVLDAVPDSIADLVGVSRAMSSHTDHSEEEIGVVFWPQDKSGIYWIRVSDSSVPGGNLPLNYVTSFVYDRYAPGLCDIFYPNGRRWARRVITLFDDNEFNGHMGEYSREFIYNNLELRDDATGTAKWTTTSEGEVKDYRNTNIYQPAMVTRNVTFVEGTLPNDSTTLRVSRTEQPQWILNSAVDMGVDSNGRVQKATLLERTPSGALLAVGSKEINDLGELYREQDFDETVTVQIRNSIGQTMRVYQGTEDRQWYLPPSAWSGIPSPNMILLERSEYGSGVNDAWLPTIVRQYDNTPSWAENDLFADEPDVVDDNGVPIGDIDGRATIIGYDWQSRAVRTDTYGKGDPFSDAAENQSRRLSTSLVYLDYLDRPYLEVTYGQDPVGVDPGSKLVIPINLDPTSYLDAELFPMNAGNELDVAQLYFGEGHLRPTSVTQSVYSVDGTLIERRSYDSGWDIAVSPSPTYLASYSYNGRGGNQIFSQSPGGSVEVTHLDSVGRVSSTAMMMPTTDMYSGSNFPVDLGERERTDMFYDADGNVVETKRWERIGAYGGEGGEGGEGDEILDLSNAVRTRTLNWYDVQKRLVATASLGTESSNGYIASPEIYTHASPGPGDDYTAFLPPSWDEATAKVVFEGVDLDQSLLANALVRVYVYDETGNKILSVDPEGIATRYEYTAAGRLAYKIENAADPVWENQRMSGYRYRAGRLVEMNLVTLDGRGNDPVQTGDPFIFITLDVAPEDVDIENGLNFAHRTRLEYGADIVSSNGAGGYWVSSRNNKLIGAMHLPNEQTGYPADDADVILRYTYSGQIAQRFNSAGEAFKYLYNDLGRLTDVIVGVWDPTQPPVFVDIGPAQGSGLSTPEPTDKIRYLHYSYDARGNLTDVEAWTEQDAADRILITHTRMAYDARDRLVNEWQLHGEGIIDDLKTPHMAYTWEYEPTDLGFGGVGTARTGHDRLTSMTYPVPEVNTNPRTLTLKYGGLDGSDEDMLSRLTAIRSNIGTLHLAGFEYSGSGRRVSLDLKNGKVSSSANYNVVPSTPELNGYDMFGRKTESRYTDNVSNILYRANYTFDKVGNRTSALIQQADVGGQSRDNIRSVVNIYDDLHRLIGAEVGEIDLAADPINNPQIKLNTTVHNDSWSLDRLGNWTGKIDDQTGQLLEHGRHTTGTLDSFGVPWSISTYDSYTSYDFGLTQAVTERDSITQLGIFEQTDGGAAVEKSVQPVYDGAGRTLFDGEYGYHYDAWGRVVQINEASVVYNDLTGLAVGFTYDRMLKHFVYDGFGRLIRTSSPVDDPDAGESAQIVQSISFFYDGARRVQEIINDPVSTIAGALNSGDTGLQGLAGESTNLNNPDGSNAPLSLEKGQNPQPLTRNIYREYVWGSGDNGPDELLLQTDELDEEYWCLMDGGGDLVALATVDASSNVQIVRQWTYDAYGAILTAEHLGASLETHVGHKGLFVDRLDVAMSVDASESPRLVPFGHTIYQNRNRSYSPSLGRFLQMDPNQTAMALLSNTASHGRGLGAIAIAFSMEGMYGDGLNLYQYLGSNPWTSSDPLGLSGGRVDPWELSEAIINEYIGARAAILSSFGNDLAAAAIIAAQIASYLPFPGVGLAGDLALVALGEISMEEAIMGAAIGVIPGGKLLKLLKKSGAGKAIGAMGSATWAQAKRISGGVLRGAGGIAARAAKWVARKAAKLVGIGRCGCFTATTLVMTANGAVPIVDIEAGHQVFSAVDDGLSQDYSSNEVGTKIIIGEAALVQLHLLHEDGSTETINTTDEHPFHVADTAQWTRADQLLIGDELSTISGATMLTGVVFTTERVPVYNLSILGSPTYYVGEHGVWVHNCKVPGAPNRFSKWKAKKMAKKHGFVDEHAFKADWISKDELSKWDMFKDKVSETIWLGKKQADEWIDTGLSAD